MPRRILLRERVAQPQGLIGPAGDVLGMRVTLLHTPSMGAVETARGLRRSGQLGAGVSLESMSGGETAYRFTGAQASGACSFGVARATQSSGSFVTLVRFRLNALTACKPFSCWGVGGNFLTEVNINGEIVTACGDTQNGSVYARATSGLFLQTGVTYTVALGYLGGNPPTFTGAINGRALSFPTNVAGFGDASIMRDSGVLNTQIGVADDGGPMNGFVSLAAVLVGRHSQATLDSLTRNPWQVAEPVGRTVQPSLTVTAYRPGSDIAVSGWSAVGAASVAAAMADPSQANYAEVRPGSNGVCTWLSPVPAGSIDLTLTLRRVGTQGEVRLVLLNAGGSEVGASAWQSAPLAAFSDVNFLSVAVSATSTQFRIETRP